MRLSRRANGTLWAIALCGTALFVPRGLAAQASAGSASAGVDVASLVEAGKRQFDQGDYAISIATLRSAIARNPGNAEALYWLGRGFYEIRDYDNAIAQIEKATDLDSQNPIYHQWLGRAYGGKADRDHSFFLARKVKKEFQTAVRLSPANLTARRDLEEYCLEAPWIVGGSKDEALAQVNAIAAMDPAEGRLARARYDLEGLKKPADAAFEYHAVLAAAPNRMEPYLEAVSFFASQNSLSDMQTAMQAAARVNTSDLRLVFYRGVAEVLSGTDPSGAEEDLKSYLARAPERSDWPSHAAAREWLGRLYEAEGKPLDAAEQYRAALQLDPQRSGARDRLQKLEKSGP